jgi:hypothetical protein
VFRISAKHQKSNSVASSYFFNVDTVVTFLTMWIHFDIEADLEVKQPTFL